MLSLLPLALALFPAAAAVLDRVPTVGMWYAENALPVHELRPLASFPTAWEGRWFQVDRNYAAFERWFSDHLGLRDLMIRSKNELDYRLFRSSARVYFGKRGDLYGRNIVDNQLPATEALLDTPEERAQVHAGLVRYSERLEADGITPVYIAPMQKQYFYTGRLPLFAPRLAEASHFMALYESLKSDPRLHFVDVYGILKALKVKDRKRIYYRQDFHWTPISAYAVGQETVKRIASLEGSSLRWTRPLELAMVPFEGSETRFAGRLNAKERVDEEILVKSWTDVHRITELDAAQTGLEFVTDHVDDRGLLPPACLYGNSFSDEIVALGIADFFTAFTRVDRMRDLPSVPALVRGRCKYLIVQILDIQTEEWESLKQ